MVKDVLIRKEENHVGTLIFNRPEKKNALSPELLLKIHSTLKEWSEKDEIRAVVITGGKGHPFSSGFDIAAISTELKPGMADTSTKNNPLELGLNSVRNFPYPTIAMIDGHVYGGGLNLAMCCDIRVGTNDISASMPPARLGLVYHPDGIRQFIEVIGIARTRELFFTARTYRGAEVKMMGLVDYQVPSSELETTTYGFATEIAANSPLSIKGTKRIINMMADAPVLDGKDIGKAEQLIAEAFNSDDLEEGQIAFFERRKPKFRGC
ncbi:MAG: enoyl-CoA hydratase/isomerase family protein [Deltaproteobacteria bacterium]|nr:enoyl-CoA hydratase/isomerase family protein [Deltaproteobacteria bacterium]